jgi:perosamine synthetase
MAKLAINGGERAVPRGMVKPWPPITDLDREYVLASLESSAHAFGPNCQALETEFAEWNGSQFAVTTNSGTAALHMAVAACGCGAGDEVIVPAYSWSSSATCILHHNAIPVFVDIDYRTMNIDVHKIEAAISEKTKAIVVVHLHGLPVEMDHVMAVAKKHNLKVIEDACQAHGAKYKDTKVGNIGDCAAFSFNQNKCMCSGEGGMLVTNDEEIMRTARMIWSFGEVRTPMESRDYHAYALGWMYRNNDLTAAFGRAQLAKLDSHLETLRENALALEGQLQGVAGLELPFVPEHCTHNYYNYTMRLDAKALGVDAPPATFRDAVVEALDAEGVPVKPWQSFILPAMTVFQARNAYGGGCPWNCPQAGHVSYNVSDYPNAQKHLETHICLVAPLRAPNGTDVARRMGAGIRKVLENVSELKMV